jgi:hypothetical protein
MTVIPGLPSTPLTDLNECLGVTKLKFYGTPSTQLATKYAERVVSEAFSLSGHGTRWQLQPPMTTDDVLLALAEIESQVHRATAEAASISSDLTNQTRQQTLNLHTHERPIVDEFNQSFSGQANVARKVVDALANPSQAVRSWSRGSAGEKTPPEAIAFNLADQMSRQTHLQDTRLHAAADSLRTDLDSRQRCASRALNGNSGVLGPGGCPAPLLKRCLASVQSLSLTHFPKPGEFEKQVERSGYMSATEMPVVAEGKIAFQCLRFCVAAFWPEFDWSYISTLEDAIGRLFSGPKVAGPMLAASEALALADAQNIWERGMRRVERAASAIRNGEVIAPPAANGLVSLFADPKEEHDAVWRMLSEARVANRRAAMAANILSPGGRPAAATAVTPAAAAGKKEVRYLGYTVNNNRDSWEAIFPGVCQHWAISGECKFQATCSKKHDPPLPAAQVDAHIMAVGGTVKAHVVLASLKDAG